MAIFVTPGQLSRRAELYQQLSSMIAAGVPLIRSLELAVTHRSFGGSRNSLATVAGHLKSGMTLTQSLERVHGWIPEFDIALLSVGEESGRLDSAFRLLAGYYDARATVLRETISGLAVSMLTLHVFLFVFPLGLLISFAQGIVFGPLSRCIPFVVEKLVVFAGLYGLALFLIWAAQGQRREPWRAMVESLTDLVPLLSKARRDLALARLSAALEALVVAGISVVRGWQLSAAASGSPRLRREVASWGAEFESGKTPAELVARSRLFPELFANLYNTGEVSGQLDHALGRLRTYYQDEGFRRMRLFSRVLNGTVYGLVAALVAFNVFRFYLGYFQQALGGAGL